MLAFILFHVGLEIDDENTKAAVPKFLPFDHCVRLAIFAPAFTAKI